MAAVKLARVRFRDSIDLPGESVFQFSTSDTILFGVEIDHRTGEPYNRAKVFDLSWDGPSVIVRNRKSGHTETVPFAMVRQMTILTQQITDELEKAREKRQKERERAAAGPGRPAA